MFNFGDPHDESTAVEEKVTDDETKKKRNIVTPVKKELTIATETKEEAYIEKEAAKPGDVSTEPEEETVTAPATPRRTSARKAST